MPCPVASHELLCMHETQEEAQRVVLPCERVEHAADSVGVAETGSDDKKARMVPCVAVDIPNDMFTLCFRHLLDQSGTMFVLP